MNPEIKKEEKEEIAQTWVSSIDFNNLFRLKGKKGLFSPATAKNKAGMVLFEEFLNPENRVWSSTKKVISLGGVKYNGLNVLVLFEKAENGIDLNDFLKPYETEQILKWFNYLKEKMVEYVEEGEKEIEAEEVK